MMMLRKLVHAKELDEADPKPEGKESCYRTLLTKHQAFIHHLSRLSNIWSCEHTVKMLLNSRTTHSRAMINFTWKALHHGYMSVVES